MSPEVLSQKSHGKSVDWWSLGIVIYEMAAGIIPFPGKTINPILRRAISSRYSFPRRFSSELKDIIRDFLQPLEDDRQVFPKYFITYLNLYIISNFLTKLYFALLTGIPLFKVVYC